jgi:hypothetical protein
MDKCHICGKKCSGAICDKCNKKIAEDMAKQLRKELEESRKQKAGAQRS